MNTIKHFFQEDIPATFSKGKWRIELMQFNSRLNQLEKQKNVLLNELGAKAWESKVKDDRYNTVYSKLEEVETLIGQVQQEMDNLQNNINQETDHLRTVMADYETKLKGVQNQRQDATQKLVALQTEQKNIEQRLNQLQTVISQGAANVKNLQTQIDQLQVSDQADKDLKIDSFRDTISTVQMQMNDATFQLTGAKSEFESNQAKQNPIKNEIDGYNQLINMLQEQNRSETGVIQEKTKITQQSLIKVNEKKNALLKQMSSFMPELGSQVYQFRPGKESLSPIYAKIDAMQNEIKGVNDQINLTHARMASVNSKSLQRVAITGGAVVLIIAFIVIFAAGVLPFLVRALKPDPKSNIHLVQSWTIENCNTGVSQSEGTYLDISVWENRQSDANANVQAAIKLLGSNDLILDSTSSNMEIAPKGLAVSMVNMDSKGSRVQKVSRSINSVSFTSPLTRLSNIGVKPLFEKSQNSYNITLGLEISNNSDFGFVPSDSAYAFVVNKQNKVIDVLVGSLNDNIIRLDSVSKVSFQSINYYNSMPCFQNDYSQEEVTFWYFVPLQIATSPTGLFAVSGKVDYKP